MVKKERFKLGPYVSLILRKGNEILLIRRYQTGCHDGLYCCAGGGVDGNEPITHALIREAHEELGITLKRENLRIVHVLHSIKAAAGGAEVIGFYIEATAWDGEPRNMEPHKCDAVTWFALEGLPQNMPPHLKQVLDLVSRGVFYSEFGWD